MTCTHHWRIKIPNGPLSEGVCLRCQEHRYFKNSEDEWTSTVRSVKAHKMYSTTDKTRWQETYRK